MQKPKRERRRGRERETTNKVFDEQNKNHLDDSFKIKSYYPLKIYKYTLQLLFVTREAILVRRLESDLEYICYMAEGNGFFWIFYKNDQCNF